MARELADQRFDRSGQAQPALMKRGPLRQAREQVAKLAASSPQEPFIARHTHDRLDYAERDELRVREILRRAFPGLAGRKSSAVQSTAISSRSRSASIEAPLGRR